MIRIVLLSLVMLVLSACAGQVRQFSMLQSLPDAAHPAPEIVTAGAIDASDIPMIRKDGVRHVIDLRADSETPDFDEAAAVREAGMSYDNLPIRGVQDLTRENVERFDHLITTRSHESTLVHCASSNRVGALAALRAAWINGKSTEEALTIGHAWGLRSLEPAVKSALLNAQMHAAHPASSAGAG